VTIKGGNGSGTTTVTGGGVTIQGGNATGASGTRTGGTVSIDAGTGSSFANNGSITLGSTNAATINIGSTTLAANTQTINVGSNNTAGSTTNVTIGSGSSATAGATTLRAHDAVTITAGAASTWSTTAGSLTLQGAGGVTINTPGSASASTNGITIQSGSASVGSNLNAGTILIDTGTQTGTGTAIINLGTTNARTIGLGNASSTTTLNGTVKVATVGASTANSTTLCRDTSTTNLTSCDSTNTTGKPFLQGGNNFGATGVLGTQDSNSLQVITNNVVRATFDTSNGLYLGNGVTAAAPNNFTVRGTGSSTVGTAGALLTLQGGSGATSSTGSAGGNMLIQGGDAGGTGNNAAGNVTLSPGLRTGTGTLGSVIVKPVNAANDSTALFQVQNGAGTTNALVVDVSNARVGINLSVGTAPATGLEVGGAIRLSTTTVDTYTTPVGSSLTSKINIPNYNPGQFNQIIAMGLPSTAHAQSRAISLLDARATAHDPTIAVFSPDENGTVGFNWNGSNAIALVETGEMIYSGGTSKSIALQSGNVANGNGSSGNVQINTGTITGGTGGSTGSIFLVTGDGTGTNSSSGSVSIDTGAKTGTGTNGSITIGATNAPSVAVGRSSGTTTLNGTVKLTTVGTVTANTASLCRDTSTTNLIACDNTNTTGRPFLQGGNNFGATGVLGTQDSNSLQIITNNITRATFDTSNNLYLGNGVTAAAPNNFSVLATGSTTAGTAGANITLQGGAGASATTGSVGGNVLIAGGNAGGTGNNAGGTITLQGGNKTGTGTGGGVLVKNSADSTNAFRVQNAGGTSTVLNVDTASGFVGINTAAPTADLSFGQGADRTVNVLTRSTNAAGNALTLKAGDAGAGASAFNGGNVILQAGSAGGTGAADGGNVYLKTGLKAGGGEGGQIILQNTGSRVDFVSMQNASGEELFHLYDNTAAPGHYNGYLFLGGPCCNISTPYQVTLSATDVVESSLAIGIDTTGVGSGNGKDFQLAAGSTNDTNMNGGSVVLTGGNKNGTGTVGGVIVRNLADGANAFRVQNSAGTTDYVSVNSSTGAIVLGTASQTGTITVGQSTAANTINIGSANFTAANTQTINIANGSQTTAASTLAVNILSGAAGNSGTATLSLANNDRVTQVDVGNVAADANRTLNLFTGNTITGTTDTINIGTGNAVGAKVIHIGDGTPTGTNTVTVGSIASTANVTTIQGGNGAGAISVQAAGSGTINIGNTNNNQLTLGGSSSVVKLGSLGASTATAVAVCRDSSTTNLIACGSGGTGAPFLQGGNSFGATGVLGTSDNNQLQIKTNNIVRATFDNATNSLYLGLGVTNAAPTNFTLSATASSTTGVPGATLTVQGGNATVGNANGGNLNLNGGSPVGTGANGLVVINTPTFQTASTQACGSNCTITQANIDSNGAVVVNATAGSLTVTMNDPTIATAGRIVYVTAANGSNDFTLSVNGGGTGNQIAMRSNTTATMIWNGSDWTAAGASSSTTLQAAYDNTLTSAGGAELVLSNSANANGLTIRDSSSNPVNGTLLEVQNKTAANIFSVNSSVTDYANNGGAESAFGTEWSATGTATVSRNTATATYIDTGVASVSVNPTAASSGVKNTLTSTLTPNLRYNVSFAARLTSGSATFNDLAVVYSVDGTASSAVCTNYSTTTVNTSVWTKINCTFTAPSSGLTATNAVFIRQTASATRTFYVDNFSVTVSADLNYATDGSVDDNTNFGTNWTAVAGASISRSTSVGNDTSDSAQVITTTTNQGVRNKLSINPFTNTLYRITAYVASTTSGFNTFTVRYSRDGGTNFVACADYNTQTISSSTTTFTQVNCYITTDGTAATTPYVYFTQTDATGRTWYVDTFTMALSNNTVPNVQVGGGVNGGPLTLFTLDRGASAPIAANNDALLGSMYYDTTLGKLQCYEIDGWGACGSSPDNIITLSPEYTNAVLHGTGVGTMTSDFCSDTLNINDGSASQPTICGTNETYNFYKWTSPQPTSQTYSIYVTYQLPQTFKTFSSGQTSIMGRTDNGSSGGSATVQYSVYRNDASGLTQCGSTVAVSTGTVGSWQTGIASGAADPSTCSFSGGNSLVFKIDVIASKDANAYVGNIGFTFTNK
jgi:hypothetical protein